jgi:hypothetical protein
MTSANVCAQCENQAHPVTTHNGFTFRYRVTRVQGVEMWLHDDCSDTWGQDFGVSMEQSA